jgi:hypothetical protein
MDDIVGDAVNLREGAVRYFLTQRPYLRARSKRLPLRPLFSGSLGAAMSGGPQCVQRSAALRRDALGEPHFVEALSKMSRDAVPP